MRKTFWGMMTLLMFAMVGMTSCKKDNAPAMPSYSQSKALIGTWRTTDNDWYCDLTFYDEGYALFELYYYDYWNDNGFELNEREMFSYTYFDEDGTLLIPVYSEFCEFLEDRDVVIGGGHKWQEPSLMACTVKAFTSNSFILIDYQTSLSQVLMFNRIN